ncbi:MAG: leucine-rich repeat domain-containing protein [Spirochaetaceae bacterium]|nr:leucine-rich repeat domain-containing protein [Spirochaetaceae bacterium]
MIKKRFFVGMAVLALMTVCGAALFAQTEDDFDTREADGGVVITGYKGSGGNVAIPASIGGKAVVGIGNEAFSRSGLILTSVVIPNSVTYIGGSAFSGNRLSSVVIPDSVTGIGNYAFFGNQLTSVVIGNNVSIGNNAFSVSKDSSFEDAYNKNKKKAGTYTRPNAESKKWKWISQTAQGGKTKNTRFSFGVRLPFEIPTYEASSGLDDLAMGESLELNGTPASGLGGLVIYKFTDLIGVQAEINLMLNAFDAKVDDTSVFEGEAGLLQIPVLLNLGTTQFLGSELTVGVVVGPYFTIPLGAAKLKVMDTGMDAAWTGSTGIMIRTYCGRKLGPGSLFWDLGYARNFDDTKFEVFGEKIKVFKRSAMAMGAGYLFRF